MPKMINGEIEIIYEDDALLVVDKPSGMIVNRSNTTREKTLQDFLDSYLNLETDSSKLGEVFTRRSGLAHRLDKGTSGVLLIAKNPLVLKKLMKQFKRRVVNKEYIVLVHGKLKDPLIEVKAPLGRNPQNRLKFAVVREGKPAETMFRKLNFRQKYSLVSAKPKTGRTHQIRVHLSALGHPVVGDTLYTPRSIREEDKEKFGRMMLHAHKIELIHPLSGKKVTYEANIPAEFKEYY